jgi:erythromycin esterase-like protein
VIRDLDQLATVFRDTRVIGVGEPTHGAHESIAFAHQLLEQLTGPLNITQFIIEASRSACTAIDDYVLGGTGDVATLLKRQRYWTVDNAELANLIGWMRRHNASITDTRPSAPLRFSGCDVQPVEPVEPVDPVEQRVQPRVDARWRDAQMAEQVIDLTRRMPPHQRAILFAHSAHVTTRPARQALGWHLRQQLGTAYYALAVCFNSGEFVALSPDGRLHTYRVGPAPQGTVEWWIAQANLPTCFLDFRTLPSSSPMAPWLESEMAMRSIGAIYAGEQHAFRPTVLRRDFDGVMFFDTVSAVHTYRRCEVFPQRADSISSIEERIPRS